MNRLSKGSERDGIIVDGRIGNLNPSTTLEAR